MVSFVLLCLALTVFVTGQEAPQEERNISQENAIPEMKSKRQAAGPDPGTQLANGGIQNLPPQGAPISNPGQGGMQNIPANWAPNTNPAQGGIQQPPPNWAPNTNPAQGGIQQPPPNWAPNYPQGNYPEAGVGNAQPGLNPRQGGILPGHSPATSNPLQDGYYLPNPSYPNDEGYGIPSLSPVEMQSQCYGSPRIVGGTNSQWEDAPFMVSLRDLPYDKAGDYGNGHFCGGAILTERVVISAASCFQNRLYSNVGVVVGSLHRRKEARGATQLLYVNKLISHSAYSPGNPRNDIGLLILKTNIKFGDYVHTISLPRKSPKQGEKCQIFGWGQISMQVPRYTDCLQKATVEVQKWQECKRQAQEQQFELPTTSLCAGSFDGGADTCVGDSGGALVCRGSLAGITTDRVGCGEPRMAKIYTDVYQQQKWIDKTIQQFGRMYSVKAYGLGKPVKGRKQARGRQDDGAEGGTGRQSCSAALFAIAGLYILL
ncbi:transmembrane protease serine 9-like [Sabethes cyaneus]|uniref:transmembrane protease serine 9-like n=1 Tax=Sabethes cyaneus TaxID=53552 RepID=UPI00237EB029|nr:transmembrane protease serine 9-like [Sabethes cyaneus]